MTETSDDKRDFFISFNQVDRTWATWIAWVLEENGYSVFFQDWDFRGSFLEQMHQASLRTGRTLVVLSNQYFHSEYAHSEAWAALARDPVGREDRVVTIKVGPTTDDLGLFSHFAYLDLTTSTEAEAERLVLERARKAIEADYRAKPSTRPDFPGGAERKVPEKPTFPGMVQESSSQIGGVNISGSVGSVGGDIVGHNKIVGAPSATAFDGALRPLIEAIGAASAEVRSEAEAKLVVLKQEVVKGKDANDGVIAKLVDGLVGLVPGAASAVMSAFAMPILGGIAGPITGFVLDRLPEDNIRFTVCTPLEIKPKVWFTLLVYLHTLKMQTEVEKDAKQRLQVPHSRRRTKAIRPIAKGAEIVIVPELPGCQFNPPLARLLWLEDWHRIEFRLQAQPDIAGFKLGKAVNGRVAFYVELVLVGEVPIWTCISDEADIMAADAPASTASAEPYEAIFVSYAHEDSVVVNRLGKAYKVLGMEFLRDVEVLRSGEKWNPALLAMIERANIFQLYWSRAAKRSRYVRQEWHHALKQEKSHFIRPFYWQVPMPQPPRELAQLHFSYFKLET